MWDMNSFNVRFLSLFIYIPIDDYLQYSIYFYLPFCFYYFSFYLWVYIFLNLIRFIIHVHNYNRLCLRKGILKNKKLICPKLKNRMMLSPTDNQRKRLKYRKLNLVTLLAVQPIREKLRTNKLSIRSFNL